MSELLWDGMRGLSAGKRSPLSSRDFRRDPVSGAATIPDAGRRSLTDPLYVGPAIGEKVVIATLQDVIVRENRRARHGALAVSNDTIAEGRRRSINEYSACEKV